MDNPTTDPQGAVDVSASEGQSTNVETQPVQETPVKEAEVQEQAQPWDADDKFKGKSADDVYNSYKELEKKQGELGNKAKVADMIEKQYGVDPDTFEKMVTEQSQQQSQGQQVDPTQQLQQQVMQTQQQLAMMKEEQALDNFLQENPDYAPFKDKLMKLAFTAEQDKPYEDIAKDYFGEAIKTGQQSAYNKIETKQQTQPTGVTTSEAQKPDLKDMSADEMEKVLPWAN